MAYKLEFSLRQHTPLIHFHNQAGATLRATELKPKLDKFIVHELARVDPDVYERYKECIKKENFPLLYSEAKDRNKPSGYSLHVTGDLQEEYYLFAYPSDITTLVKKELNRLNDQYLHVINKSPFFANNQYVKSRRGQRSFDNSEAVKVAQMGKNIKVDVVSFISQICELIGEVLPYVLALENFGTRQSKGLGCFMPDSIKPKDEEGLFKKLLRNVEQSEQCDLETIYVKTRDQKTKTIEQCLSEIANEWRLIKAGNSFGGYEKSDLMKFFWKSNSNEVRWEKRFIKKEIHNQFPTIWNDLKRTHESYGGDDYPDRKEDYQYVRALLGLAEHNEYSTESGKIQIKIDSAAEKEEEKIARFKSPVTYKITEHSIYLIIHKIPQKLDNHHFTFKIANQANGTLGSSLPIPAKFSFKKFFNSRPKRNNGDVDGRYPSIAAKYGYTELKP
jgi:hypothetical protein